MSGMEAHHMAWLEGHSHRTEEWLRGQLKDGFDVHHIDGNHANNDPLNLALIEHTDHMMLHGGRMLGRLQVKAKKRDSYIPRKLTPKRMNKAIAVYLSAIGRAPA